ncbi:MAG: DUF1122 family protein [Candidatus Methylomirabilales bacterium]
MVKENLDPEHPLLRLRGRRIEQHTLDVEAWAGRFVGQAEFLVYLKEAGGARSDRPVVEGLYGRTRIPGSQGEVERGILDVQLARAVEFGSTRVQVQGTTLEQGVMHVLCGTIEDTWGAIMYLAYGWKTLKQIQELHHPFQVTDEGHLLFTHGFRGGWKDYYYSEGWWEGPIKLKAERPPTAEYRSRWDAENARDLLAFLRRPPGDGHIRYREEGTDEMVTLPLLALERTARARALLMLRALDLADAGLSDERRRIVTLCPPPEVLRGLSRADLEGLAAQTRERP